MSSSVRASPRLEDRSLWHRLRPRRDDYPRRGATLRRDVVAGVTVGVVALPLALAFGITTGLGAAAGLTTAIVAGVVAGVLGGSGVQVSGPTGAMTVVLVPLVARHGPGAVAVVGVMAGIMLVGAALLGLGRYLAYLPWPVVEGFTVGIATIIFLQQVPAALGIPTPEGENTAVVAARALTEASIGTGLSSILIVVIVVAAMVLLPHLRRSLPASLLAVVAATVLAVATGWDVAAVGTLPSSLTAPSLPSVGLGDLRGFIGPALAVAALAGIESLLSARVADGMVDAEPHDPDRELLGQGAANIVSPLFGGMPATGAIARTAVNVRAGATTRVASIVHALTLLVVVLFLGSVVARVPLAALAGVLMVTAIRMVERHNVLAVLRSTRSDAVVFVVTAAVTIAVDLVMAVGVGVAAAALLALRHVARTSSLTAEPVEVDPDLGADLRAERIVTYRIDGALFFGAAQRFLDELSRVTDIDVVILRLPDLQMLDATGAQALAAIIEDLESRGITVLLKGARPEHRRTLHAVGALDRLATGQHVFTELEPAIAHARALVRARDT